MLRIRPNVRTTPTVRAKIPGSGEPSSILARRYERGTSTGQNIAWTTQPLRWTSSPALEGHQGKARWSCDDLAQAVEHRRRDTAAAVPG